MLAKPSETALLQKRRSELSTKHLPTRDGNGFRRLLLLLTASGASSDENQSRSCEMKKHVPHATWMPPPVNTEAEAALKLLRRRCSLPVPDVATAIETPPHGIPLLARRLPMQRREGAHANCAHVAAQASWRRCTTSAARVICSGCRA